MTTRIDSFFGKVPLLRNKFINKFTHKEIAVKKSIAEDNRQKKFTGVVTCTSKNGNEWELDYVDGRITQSKKNGEMQKLYTYPKLNGPSYFFRDGSFVDEKEFYGFKTPDSIVVYDGKSTTTIIKYQQPRYKNQSIIDVEVQDEEGTKTRRVLKEDGKPKFEFQSMDEVEDYFYKKYGITVEFDSLAQAHIVRDAIEEFLKLNINKNIFRGLSILVDSDECYEGLEEFFNEEYDDDSDEESYEQDYDTDEYKADEEDGEIAERKSSPMPIAIFIHDYQATKNASKEIKKDRSGLSKKNPRPIIFLNRDFDWSSSRDSEDAEESGYSSYSTLKGDIQHELGHYLHFKYSPAKFLMPVKPEDNSKKKDLMERVSYYSTIDSSEFVAEYIAGRLEGKTYPKKVNLLYKQFGGPNIFQD